MAAGMTDAISSFMVWTYQSHIMLDCSYITCADDVSSIIVTGQHGSWPNISDLNTAAKKHLAEFHSDNEEKST